MRIDAVSNTGIRGQSLTRVTQLPVVAPIFFVVCATLLWAGSLKDIDVTKMNDLGLVSVLPASVFAALVILVISFCLVLSQERINTPVVLLHLVVLIFILYGTTTLVEQAPRFQSTWKHIGVTDYILRTGQINPRIDAYFNWPVFFILSGLITEVGGFQSMVSFVGWAPVFLNLIYLGGLYILLGAGTVDKRLVWLGIWFFYLTNWVGQDYFSPQGFNFFLFIVIIGIVLKWFKAMIVEPDPIPWERFLFRNGALSRLANRIYSWLTPVQSPSTPSTPAQRVGLVAIVLILFTVVASSHQLTPFFTLGAIMALVVFNRCSLRGLPVLLGVILVTWLSYMAVTYMAGHFAHVTGHVGEVGTSVGANVTKRLQGSPDHMVVIYIRLVMTVAIWGLAVLGGIRRLRSGRWDITYALLAFAPFPVMALQSYGGEMVLRVYLFALPFMVFFAAAFFFPVPWIKTSWRTVIMMVLVSLGLLAGFVFSRYGNERMDYMTVEEEAALSYLYEIAEPRSLLVAATPNLPWKFAGYGEQRYKVLTKEVLSGDVDAIVAAIQKEKHTQAYLILTRSQEAHAELFYSVKPADWGKLLIKLTESGKFVNVFSNEASDIYLLVEKKSGSKSKP